MSCTLCFVQCRAHVLLTIVDCDKNKLFLFPKDYSDVNDGGGGRCERGHVVTMELRLHL